MSWSTAWLIYYTNPKIKTVIQSKDFLLRIGLYKRLSKKENKVFLPALVNPTAVRTSGAAATAPTPAAAATPTAPTTFRVLFPKKIAKHNYHVFCIKGENNSIYQLFSKKKLVCGH